jgi:ferrochelatase
MPGFAADCLETLEEMAMQNRDLFLGQGGSRYDVIPCLNDSETGIAMLHSLVVQELAGWIAA